MEGRGNQHLSNIQEENAIAIVEFSGTSEAGHYALRFVGALNILNPTVPNIPKKTNPILSVCN